MGGGVVYVNVVCRLSVADAVLVHNGGGIGVDENDTADVVSVFCGLLMARVFWVVLTVGVDVVCWCRHG